MLTMMAEKFVIASFAPKINLYQLTLPQRRYLLYLRKIAGLFTNNEELSWLTSTRKQLTKRQMVERMMIKDGQSIIGMTAHGQRALQSF